jgi:hypothetical protein
MKSSKTPTVIAVTALVVAALAATPIGQAAGRIVLGKNSVGTAQLKKNAVTGAKVKNGSLRAVDFGAGQLPAGPQGPRGDTGARGPQGDRGPSNGYIHPWSNSPIYIDGAQGATLATLNLPAGKYIVFAKTVAATTFNGGVTVQCTLTAGDGYDYSAFFVHPTAGQAETTALNIGVTLASAGHAQLWCRGLGQTTWARDYSMSAVKVDQLATS